MSEAKLSDKLYRWRGDDGGWQIGRIVEGAADMRDPVEHLLRCDFGRLYWVDSRKLEPHDTAYREQEREAERC